LREQLNGFIKIYRSMLKWEWYEDVNTKAVFLHLLLTANFKDTKWQGITIRRGEVVTSYEHLAKEVNLSVQNVRTALKHLRSTGEITSTSSAKYTIISINNYDEFQSDNTSQNSQSTNSKQADNIQITNDQPQRKKDNNDNNDKKEKNVAEERTVKVLNSYNTYCLSFDREYWLSKIAVRYLSVIELMYPSFNYDRYFQRVEDSDFLSGRNGRWNIGRCACLDWLLNPVNLKKVMNGQFDNN